MKKVLTWILNHLKLVVAVTTAVVTLIVVGCVMLASNAAYKANVKKYDENDLRVRSALEASPRTMRINDDFAKYNEKGVTSTKSTTKNKFTAFADELIIDTNCSLDGEGKLDTCVVTGSSGGEVALNLTVDKTTFVDIDFVIATTYFDELKKDETSDILDKVSITVNNATVEGSVRYVKTIESNYHHLVMTGFAIPAGDLNIKFKTTSATGDAVTGIRNISVFADATIATSTAE